MAGSRLCSVMNLLSLELLVKNPSNGVPPLYDMVRFLKSLLLVYCHNIFRRLIPLVNSVGVEKA